ncbi:MAG: extracellular solute-binding protein [Alphaproteobacteria bacterium]|nr:extracellular solute-binding protein [Alphaproteobacteria bacterium]
MFFSIPGIGATEEKFLPPVHALSLDDSIKYSADFKQLDYVNPSAPKGGTIYFSAIGTYDNFNPFILKGSPAAGVGELYETLASSTADDASSEYGLIAESIQVAVDKKSVIFNLRPEAKWHDQQPITADDVVFSFNILKEKGHPQYQTYYRDVDTAEALNSHKVKFTFKTDQNKELAYIVGELPILPKHYWERRSFNDVLLEPPLGSGPYKITGYDMGRSVILERVKDYWGKDLSLNKGRNNWDKIRYDYYLDPTVAFEAFKSGQYDFRLETSAKQWATAYDFPAVKNGNVILEKIKHQLPQGLQAYAFNTRRDLFKDPKVRQALGYVFDFEWSNKNLFFNQYERAYSFFSNSELASQGLPDEEELKILNPFRDQLPPELFTQEYKAPVTDGTGNIRNQLQKALDLLKQAGWVVKDNKLINSKTNQPMVFEILLDNPLFERISQPFVKNLERLGIKATVRTVDSAQYQNRMDHFDFDMIVQTFAQSLSPGNEQRDFWGSASADISGSRNIIGIKNPVIDALVNSIIDAPDRHSLVIRTRALDRVLLWNYYVIPQWYINYHRIAFWNVFGKPEKNPEYQGFDLSSWWIDQDKRQKLGNQKR